MARGLKFSAQAAGLISAVQRSRLQAQKNPALCKIHFAHTRFKRTERRRRMTLKLRPPRKQVGVFAVGRQMHGAHQAGGPRQVWSFSEPRGLKRGPLWRGRARNTDGFGGQRPLQRGQLVLSPANSLRRRLGRLGQQVGHARGLKGLNRAHLRCLGGGAGRQGSKRKKGCGNPDHGL